MFLRFTEKFRCQAVFAAQAEKIAQLLIAVLSDCESGQIPVETLGVEEQRDLYSVLGIVSSNENVPEALRTQLLTHILDR